MGLKEEGVIRWTWNPAPGRGPAKSVTGALGWHSPFVRMIGRTGGGENPWNE